MWSNEWDNSGGHQAQTSIVVTGNRPSDPLVQSVSPDDLYIVGQFDIQAALFGNGHYGQQPSAPPQPAMGGLDIGDDFFWF